MKLILKTVLFLFIGLLSFNSVAAVKVVTTTQDLQAIAEAIGGEHINAISLTPGTRDPHFASARPSMIRQVYQADLLLVIGADLEIGWLPALLQSARNPEIQVGKTGYLDLSTVIPLLDKPTGPVSRAMGDVHANGNPHYWLDPHNGIRMAVAIADRLSQIDKTHAADYQKRLQVFEVQLNKKIHDWKQALAPLKGQEVIAYHKSFVYLANAFGFRIVDEVEPKPGIAPSAASLSKLINRIRDEKIPLLIMEPYYERRSAEYLHQKTGIRIAVLPQSVGAQDTIKTYFDLFDAIVDELKTN